MHSNRVDLRSTQNLKIFINSFTWTSWTMQITMKLVTWFGGLLVWLKSWCFDKIMGNFKAHYSPHCISFHAFSLSLKWNPLSLSPKTSCTYLSISIQKFHPHLIFVPSGCIQSIHTNNGCNFSGFVASSFHLDPVFIRSKNLFPWLANFDCSWLGVTFDTFYQFLAKILSFLKHLSAQPNLQRVLLEKSWRKFRKSL